MEFKEIVEKRYATKKFDGTQLPQEKVDELLEMIRMAPSSYGLQPWVVKVISDNETKEKLLEHTFNQPQITTCSQILVFCANVDVKSRIDGYEQMMKDSGASEETVSGYIEMMRGTEKSMDDQAKVAWAQRQTYIALGNAVNGAKALGFDSCPMEGFDPDKYKKILGLSENLVPTALVTIGIASDEQNPKIRFPKEDLFI